VSEAPQHVSPDQVRQLPTYKLLKSLYFELRGSSVGSRQSKKGGVRLTGREFISLIENAGFENKLADLFAKEMGPVGLVCVMGTARSYIRTSLKAGECDGRMGVPIELDPVETVRPLLLLQRCLRPAFRSPTRHFVQEILLKSRCFSLLVRS
jgi:hypothetical protein